MAEDNFQLNNHQVFPNNTIPSVGTIREHREEIDNRYFDKVINYCMRNDISPKEYFEKELDKPKTPSPEKFSYHSMEMKAWEVERGTYQEPTYQPEYYVYTGPTLGDKIGDWLYERSLDSQGLSEQEKETLRAKHDAEKNMAKEQEDRLREKEYLNSLKQQGDPALQKTNWLERIFSPPPMPESRFDSEKDKREYMFEKSLEYAENRGNVIAENLKSKDAARGIDKGPDYDYYSVGYVLAVRQFEGHDFDRGKAEAIVEQNRERHLVREIKNLKEERTEQNKDSSYTKERTESLEKQLEEKCTQAKDIYYQREVDRYCEEHHISRDTYNSLVKDAERDGRLDQFPAEEWNAKRPFDEREELKEARYERECREIESQEKEVRFHGDSRFG